MFSTVQFKNSSYHRIL